MENEFLIIGLTRFSVVTEKTLQSFVSTRGKALSEAEDVIFNDQRMERRFSLFEYFCFSTHKRLSKENYNFYGIVFISKNMPAKWKDRLYALIEPFSSLNIVEISPDASFHEEVTRAVKSLSNGKHAFTFRIDDDDALPSGFCEDVLNVYANVKHLDVLSFDNGLQVARYGDDHYRVWSRNYPLIAIGLGVYDLESEGKTIFHLGDHSRMSEKFNVIHLEREASWLRIVHPDNDSRLGTVDKEKISKAGFIKKYEERFPHIGVGSLSSIPIKFIDNKYTRKRILST